MAAIKFLFMKHPLACSCLACLFITSGALEHCEHQPHAHAETHEDAWRGLANYVEAAASSSGAGNHYTLDAEPGAYTITGQPTDLSTA